MFAQSSTTTSDPPLPGLVSGSFSFKSATLEDVWEDLSSRFILNVPDEELEAVERICFQVEQAHWFYEDFIRDENPDLPSLPLKKFSQQLFAACPLLRQWSASQEHEQAFQEFMRYKTRVPVCGCIMLNPSLDKCVLVKGWKASSGWGFPKGKINEDEEEHVCAIRETLEETGFDTTLLLDRQIFIKNTLKEQQLTLYIVPDVPEDTVFQTRTRKEISKIEWFKLSDLPTWKKNRLVAANNKFYLISPFVGQLKAFVSERKRQRKAARKTGRTPAIPNQEPTPYYPGQLHVDELDNASPFRPNARPHERYDDDLRMASRSTQVWDNVGPQYVKPRALAVHVGHDSESSSQNSSGTNALTSGSSAHASAIEPITPSSDTPYGNDVHVRSVETGPSNNSPHLARLLQGLSLSAVSVEPIQQPVLDSKPADQKKSPPTKSIFDFVSPFDALASPGAKPEPMPTPTPPPQTTLNDVRLVNPPANRQPLTTFGPILNPQYRATPVTPAAFADLGLVPASLTSKSPVSHKRVAATPQPYNVPNGLPQPVATPVPGDLGDHPMDRRRKQLALLESISGDADRRMTPAPQAPQMSSRTPAAQFLNYHPIPGVFQPPPPAERMQYPMNMPNGAPRPGLPPSPLYSRPVPSRAPGPEPNAHHKGHLLTLFSSTPTPMPMSMPPPPPGPYPQAMYHNNIPQPHHQFGSSSTPAPMPGPSNYGAPNYLMQPQYAPPMNGGFPPGPPGPNGSMYPAGRPYPTPGLS